jgi:hypothetical protein
MTARSGDRTALALLLDTEIDPGRPGLPGTFLRLDAHVIRLEHGQKLRNLSALQNPDLADLVVYGQAHPGGLASYGWQVGYRNAYFVDTRRARAMARTLNLVTRRLEQASARHGEPESFGGYLVRAAAALGIDSYAVAADPLQAGGWHYDHVEHRFLDAAGAQTWFDQAIEHFHATHIHS